MVREDVNTMQIELDNLEIFFVTTYREMINQSDWTKARVLCSDTKILINERYRNRGIEIDDLYNRVDLRQGEISLYRYQNDYNVNLSTGKSL